MDFLLRRLRSILFGALVIGGYVAAEARGLAFGGDTKRDPIDATQLRQASPGSWHYVYWSHGSRGK